eukprot:6209029-Pleurochrysis_carterae.AAC.3
MTQATEPVFKVRVGDMAEAESHGVRKKGRVKCNERANKICSNEVRRKKVRARSHTCVRGLGRRARVREASSQSGGGALAIRLPKPSIHDFDLNLTPEGIKQKEGRVVQKSAEPPPQTAQPLVRRTNPRRRRKVYACAHAHTCMRVKEWPMRIR